MACTGGSATFLEMVCTLTGSLFGACTLCIYHGIMFSSAEKVMICILEVITVDCCIYLQCCNLPFPFRALIPFLLCFQMLDTCSSTAHIQRLSDASAPHLPKENRICVIVLALFSSTVNITMEPVGQFWLYSSWKGKGKG